MVNLSPQWRPRFDLGSGRAPGERNGYTLQFSWVSQVVLVVKNLPSSARDITDTGSIPGSGRSLRKKWQPAPVFLPGESHGQRDLAGYSPWGHRELDKTKATWHAHTVIFCPNSLHSFLLSLPQLSQRFFPKRKTDHLLSFFLF